jgi:NDP-sugar pyrophosphorylase family protein
MSPHPSSRIRITISLTKEVAEEIDELVDGVKIRNRSHAIENLVTESLNVTYIRQAVVLAGGDNIQERIPALESALTLLKEHGITEVIMAVGYLGEEVKKAFGNGEEYNLRLHYAQSELGTGGALLQIKPKLHHTFLVINVEQPINIDIKHLLRFHREHKPLATIATPSLRDLHGIYVLEPKVLAAIPPGFCMLEDTVFHELVKQGKLLPYPILTEM